jgi:hypothetical protein
MTTREATPKRWNINLNLDRLDILVLGVLIGLFAGAVGMSLYFHFSSVGLADWLDSVLQNTGTEMFGAFLTFALIEVMLRKRREQDAENRAIEQEKERLILQMGSPDNTFAVEAARILKARGWGFKEDTTLHGANLQEANLQGANLEGASLHGAIFLRANLPEASLYGANLRGAVLMRTNLHRAFLVAANLHWANLQEANLQEANLQGANLQGAILLGANLQGVRLSSDFFGNANYDRETTLPDGSKWTPDTDLTRFTNPDHPDFWRSDKEWSPAFRGKDDND